MILEKKFTINQGTTGEDKLRAPLHISNLR
jgi:hypothetical protein